MKLTHHFIFSLIFLALYPIYHSKVFIIIAATVLIDVDHVTILIKEKDFSIRKIKKLSKEIHNNYRKNKKGAYKDIFYLFHSIEFNIILGVLAAFYPILWFVFVGFSFHIILDIIHHYATGIPIMRWLFLLEFIRVNKVK